MIAKIFGTNCTEPGYQMYNKSLISKPTKYGVRSEKKW